MRFARFVLIVQAVIMIGFSLAYWLRPYEMANLNGMLLMESASVSHMRVYYGGLQLGLALFLLWAIQVPERARAALVMLVITMLALVAGRLGSLWLDGGELIGFDLASLIYRVCAALLAAAALWLLKERPAEESAAEPDHPARRLDQGPPQPFRLGDGPAPVADAEPEPELQPFRRGDPVEPAPTRSNPPTSKPTAAVPSPSRAPDSAKIRPDAAGAACAAARHRGGCSGGTAQLRHAGRSASSRLPPRFRGFP